MAGVGEASLVLGILSSIISIIKATKQVYEAVEDEAGLPKNFKKSAANLPLISKLLEDAETYVNNAVDETVMVAFIPTIENCKLQATQLQELFAKVIPNVDDSRWDRYTKAARTIGKGGRVESLIKAILVDLQLLATNFPEVTTPRGKEQLAKAIEEVSKMAPSLLDGFEQMPAYSHYGSGHQIVNSGTGTQHNNCGPGQQYIGTNYIGQNSDGQYLQDLRTTDPCHDKTRIEKTKGGLLRDSYRWIFDTAEFRRWRNDEQSRLLWVRGGPGKGKTMLLCGIIDELKSTDTSSLLSYFFCQGTDSRINSATAVLRGLIYLLVEQQPWLGIHVRKKYDRAGKALFGDVNTWVALSEIFTDILQDLSLWRTYLIVDALDECEKDRTLLSDLIVQNSSAYPHVRWAVSSRYKIDLEQRLSLDRSCIRLCLELQEHAHQVVHAVDAYIDNRISELPELQDDTALQDKVRARMRRKANGTFLWVSFVVKELKEAMSWDILDTIDEMPTELNSVYLRMIQQVQRLKRENPHFCRMVLSTVTAAYRPLHVLELRVLSGLPENISSANESIARIVDMCGSFLTMQDGIVYIVHQSAKDFLCTDASYTTSPGVEVVHRTLFSRSLQVMSRTLQRDIYDLRAPGFPIDKVRPPDPDPLAAVHYSCVYWINHLYDGKLDSWHELADDGPISAFFKSHFLHWLESLSLLSKFSDGMRLPGRLSEGVRAIQRLEDKVDAGKSPTLYAFIHDAKRFLLYNRSIIEIAPLQLYCSALLFSPTESVIRKQFEDGIPFWICKKPRVQAKWSATLQTLEGHSSKVYSVAFSPDGKLVASGSHDHTVRLWDAGTGATLQTLKNHSSSVHSVAFSPDSKLVASGSGGYYFDLWFGGTGAGDYIVRLWDTSTGALRQRLEGHSSPVYSVAFSPDGKLIASGSGDQTIILWDTGTGALRQTVKGPSSAAFLPDGKLVMSGLDDFTIRLWDTNAGAPWQRLEGHSSWVTSVAFSPDGKLIASGSRDNTIKLWDAGTGATLQTCEGHTHAVQSVTFSPDSKRMASGSESQIVRLWDVSTGVTLQKFEGHSDFVKSVAFSPDGKQIVSGSDDKTVRLWDTSTPVPRQRLEGHSNIVLSVAFSPDGKLIASGSGDNTIRLWDAGTGVSRQTLEGHSDCINLVTFSPDGKLVASSSDDNTVRLWDTATGVALQKLEAMALVNSVVFSSDNKQVASSSYDGIPRLWDVGTGVILQKFEGHSDFVKSVAFSPDGKQIASSSLDQTVRLWDTSTPTSRQTLEGHTSWISSVAFSPDGKQIVSGSADYTVRLWDADKRVPRQTLEGHSNIVLSVAFSPDGKLIASGSRDKTVRLWDAGTGAPRQTLDVDTMISSISFTTSGQHLKTDRGVLRITSLAPYSNSPERVRSLFVSDDWVSEEGERILWLPPDYRATCVANWNGTIVLGHLSGDLSFFEFEEGLKAVY